MFKESTPRIIIFKEFTPRILIYHRWADQVRKGFLDCMEGLVSAERLDRLEDRSRKEGLNGWVDQVWLEVSDCSEDLV